MNGLNTTATPYKFKVSTSNRMSNADYYEVIEAVNVSKNTRSHLDAIQVPYDNEAQPSAVGLPLLGISINGRIWIDIKIETVPTYATGVPRLGFSLEAKMPDPTISTNQKTNLFIRLCPFRQSDNRSNAMSDFRKMSLTESWAKTY